MGVIWQHVREVIEIDLAGKIVVPGLFDMHVHFRDPGQTNKEDILSGSLAAAFGGFTGVLCMPNTIPPIDQKEIIFQNNEKSKNGIVNVYHSACVSSGRRGKVLADIKSLDEAGALAFTDDGSPVEDYELMKQILKASSEINKPVMQHCEMSSYSNGGVMHEGNVSKELGVKGIRSESEYKIIERDIELIKNVGGKYHIQHISTKEGVELARKAKIEKLLVTSEACPHHFILTDESVKQYGSNAKMNPPLRKESDMEEIINGLKDGTIDAICTDHAPHTKEEKEKGLETAPFGIVGMEVSFGLSYTYLVEKKILTLEELINKMSVNPRRLLNLPEIKFAEGEHANMTILNLEKEWEVDINNFHSKNNNCPYNGWKLKGKPAGIINGEKHLFYD
jgi:dihydroorotase